MLRSLIVLGSLACAFASGNSVRRVSFPAISPDGKSIVFRWQGDLWRVPAMGGHGERITVHSSSDTRPVWFPDGSRIAFASNRYGNSDIFTIRPDGSDLIRVTFDSSNEVPSAVSADGCVIYGSSTAFGRSNLVRVKSTGGDLVKLTDHPFEIAYQPAPSPDGRLLYYNRGAYGPNSWQKPGLKSSALPEIWVADNTVPLRNHRRLTQNERTDLSPQPSGDGMITYISNAGGAPNVWRMKADGGSAKAYTNHVNGAARNPTVTADGKKVAYEFDSDIYVLDTVGRKSEKISIEVPDDARNNPTVDLRLTESISDYAVSPDGKRAVVAIRGELFLIPEKGGTTRRLTTNPSWDFQPAWLDNKTILYVASRAGKRELKTVSHDGVGKDFLTDPANVTHPAVSPDGKQIAFHRGGDEIAVIPAAGGPLKTLLKGNFQEALDGSGMFAWSPDSRWLVANLIQGRRIETVLVEVATGRQVPVAKLSFRPQIGLGSTPQFLPNGRGIYFTSPEIDRNFDLFVVDLIPPEISFTEDDLDKLDERKDEKKPEVKVEVYEPGIELRLRQLSQGGVSGNPIASVDSKTIWVGTEGGTSGYSVSGTPAPKPVPGLPGMGQPTLSKDGKKLYFLSAGKLNGFVPGSPAPTPIPVEAQFTVNLKEEELALFQDIAWAMETLYYDPQLHGKDWPRIKAKYQALVPQAVDRGDFYAMMGEMMEELDSSHLGATAPPEPVPGQAADATAYLGIDLDPVALDARGSYVVAEVMPQSPAADPASMLRLGDKIVRVDGVPLASGMTFSSLLKGKVGKRIVLEIERDGLAKTVSIKGAGPASRGNWDYENFVAANRERVDKLSGGKLGYVHIRSMDQPSLLRFLRESRTQAEGKQGVVIDCRFNGGGSTAVDVLGVLVRQPWLIRTTRGPFGTRLSENLYRSDALELPTALLVNTASFSNAEVIAEGFRQLKRGPIVGERTPGYVIGTGGYSLWDGGFIRMPSIGAFALDGGSLENDGRKPDVTVWFDPNAWDTGRDLQLERAVQELLGGSGAK